MALVSLGNLLLLVFLGRRFTPECTSGDLPAGTVQSPPFRPNLFLVEIILEDQDARPADHGLQVGLGLFRAEKADATEQEQGR